MSTISADPSPQDKDKKNNPQPAPNPTTTTHRTDTPLQTPTTAPLATPPNHPQTDLAILSLLLKSNRITCKDYMFYRKLQHIRHSATQSTNITFRSAPTSPTVQEALNIPELLEIILLIGVQA